MSPVAALPHPHPVPTPRPFSCPPLPRRPGADDEDGGAAAAPPPGGVSAALGLPEVAFLGPEVVVAEGEALQVAGAVSAVLENMIIVQSPENTRALAEGCVWRGGVGGGCLEVVGLRVGVHVH